MTDLLYGEIGGHSDYEAVRAFAAKRFLAQERRFTAACIARELDWPLPSTRRILWEMVTRGYLTFVSYGVYELRTEEDTTNSDDQAENTADENTTEKEKSCLSRA